MAETTKKPTTRKPAATATDTFSADERAAMKERAREVRAEKSRGAAADPAAEVLAKIAEMPDEDRAMAERVHAVVMAAAPELTPRTWYGMPAYTKNGKVVVFLKPAGKFKSRYATLGFEDAAALDDGAMWPTSYALTGLSDADAERIAALVRRAAG